jgi:hypothetical protein
MVSTTLVILIEAYRTFLERKLRSFSRSECALSVRLQESILNLQVISGSSVNFIICKLHALALIVVGSVWNYLATA